jgi:hypothetical protein
MNNLFIVRVELHFATEKDYEILHAGMIGLGFSKQITGAAGIKYNLPTAEYATYSASDVTTIKNAVKNVANKTGRTSWLLVTKAAAVDWDLAMVR